MSDCTQLPAGRRPVRSTSVLAGGGIGVLLVLCLVTVAAQLRTDAPKHDFISYWATAKLMAAHANPYDPSAILRLENGAGGSFARPFIMRNPPWALLFVLPLGWLNAPAAALLWTLVVILCALGSIRLLRPGAMTRVPLNALFFAPVIGCIASGQTATLLLLGFSLFLVLERRLPFLAGLVLVLPAMKPHLFLLFWPLLLLECWRRRRFAPLAGLLCGLIAATGFALVFDPQVVSHYLTAVRGEGIQQQFLPNLACALRALHPATQWLQAVPAAIGLTIALVYWVRSPQWEWRTHGALIIATSVLVAPYSWPTDAVLFLPAILALYAKAGTPAIAFLTAINAISMLLFISQPNLSSLAYVWLAPACMGWCLWSSFGRATAQAACIPSGSEAVVTGLR